MSDLAKPTADLLGLIPQPHVVLEPVFNGAGEIVDFTFAAANPAACEINHVPLAELVGASLLSLHPNVVGTGLFAKYVEAIRHSRGFTLVDWGYPQEALGGRWRYYDVHAIPAQGRVSQTWTDVTDRHEALERLAESERRYRLVAENASEVVFQGSNDGILQWLSPQTRDIVQDMYIRKVEKKDGQLWNIEFDAIKQMKDPAKSK